MVESISVVRLSLVPAMADVIFCEECNNILYPRSDKRSKKLLYVCRSCHYISYKTSIKHNIVSRINYNYDRKEDVYIHPDTKNDPALGRVKNWLCKQCGNTEAVFLQLSERISYNPMALIYICSNKSCSYWEKEPHRKPNRGSGLFGDGRKGRGERVVVQGGYKNLSESEYVYDSDDADLYFSDIEYSSSDLSNDSSIVKIKVEKGTENNSEDSGGQYIRIKKKKKNKKNAIYIKKEPNTTHCDYWASTGTGIDPAIDSMNYAYGLSGSHPMHNTFFETNVNMPQNEHINSMQKRQEQSQEIPNFPIENSDTGSSISKGRVKIVIKKEIE